jgi:hypothetical protein
LHRILPYVLANDEVTIFRVTDFGGNRGFGSPYRNPVADSQK